MGFFTPLGNLWGKSENWGFGKTGDFLGSAWGNFTGGAKAVAGGFWNLAKSPWGGDGAFAKAFVDMNTAFSVKVPTAVVGGGMDLLNAAAEFPLAKQVIGTAGFIQNEGVKRPLGMGSLVAGDLIRGRAPMSALVPFNPWSDKGRDEWVTAYNDTRTVSTGQAFIYGSTGFTPSHDYGGLYDPRGEQGQANYHDDTFLKYSSGSLDAAVDTFADPTMYGGKVTGLVKLRWLSPALRTSAQVEKYINTSQRYVKLKKFVQEAKTSEEVRQRAFNGHVGGDKAAAALWSVRHDSVLYDQTFRALNGDPWAWRQLTQDAPRIAQLTGRMYANETMTRAANQAGFSSRADEITNAARDTELDAFGDAVANGQGDLAGSVTKDFAHAIKNEKGGFAQAKGVLAGQSAPYLSMTSKWRTGVHNWVTFGPQAFRGAAIYPVLSRARYAMPSAKFTRFLDVVDNNSVGAFRSNLERAQFTRQQLEKWVSMYGRASSPEARARIAAAAEDEGFKILASKYGWTDAQVQATLPEINKFRSANRAVFSNSRRFFTDAIRRRAERYIAEGRTAESDNLFFLGEDHEAAIRRGDQPESVHVILDEDGNNVFIPGRFRVDPAEPAMLSQRPDIMPMVDWRVLDTALWWAKKGPVGEKAYKAVNAAQALADTINTTWKLTALLRPGYVWRMLSDDVMRRISLYGASTVLMSAGPGLKNTALNWAGKSMLGRDWALRQRRRYGLDDLHSIEGQVADSVTEIARPRVGGSGAEGRYAPSPRAVEMSAAPDTLLRFALEAISGKKGYITKADFRKTHNIGDKTANNLLAELQSRGFIEHAGTKGRVNYYTSKVSKYDIGLMRKPLKYDSYDRALADGVISFNDYLSLIESHALRGDLPADLADILQAKRQGDLAPLSNKASVETAYRKNMLNYSLRSVNRGAFTRPEWQRAFLDEIVARHVERPQGMPGRRTVIDPFTGALPDLPEEAVGEIQSHWFNLSKGREVDLHPDALYDYIADNVDDLLKPTNVLHAYITPDGKLDLSVARWSGEPNLKIKETGGIRVTFKPWWSREPKGTPVERKRHPYAPAKKPEPYVGPLRRGSGFNRIRITDPVSGQTVELKAAFEGSEGQLFRAQASSTGQEGQWVNQVTHTEAARLLNEARGQRDIAPHEGKDYQTAWERAVNVQIYNDAVARHILEGWSEDKILDWMRNDPEGRAYWGRLGPMQSRPMEQIYIVKAQVDEYLPDPNEVAARVGGELSRAQRTINGATVGGSEAEGIARGGEAFQAAKDLRAAALQGRADFDSFKRLFPNVESMPHVHGASLDVAFGGPVTEWLKRRVNGMFRIMSDKPADSLSRFPFFTQRYAEHAKDITRVYFDRYRPNAPAGAGVPAYIPAEDLAKIERMSRDRALADVKKYLYDTSAALDLASAAKLFIPFSAAVGDSFLKWGVIAREQGIVAPALRIFKLWTAPDRAGLVQDQDGNVKEWDPNSQQFRWYQVNPKTHAKTELPDHKPDQEYIVFQRPSDSRSVGQYQNVLWLNKEVFNTFLGLPTAGPLVSYPVNEFALKNPKAADNRFIKNFILPYGPTSDDYKALVPSNFRSTWAFANDLYQQAKGNEPVDHRGLAQAIMQTEYTRYALGLRDKPPTMAEVQDRAEGLSHLQWASQFFGLSTQFKSPYQPYIDYYHMLQEKADEDRKAGRTEGWETGDGGVEYNALGRFYAEMGDEYRMMTASVTRNVAGLPASIEASQQLDKFKDLIAQHPELAPLIVGSEGAGKFSSAVYQAQLEQSLQPGSNTKMREVLSLPDSMADAERRYVWVKYGKLMDAIDADMIARGITSLNNKRAKDLKALREKFINANKYWTDPQGVTTVSPWFEEFGTSDRASITKRLTSMAQLATDDRLSQRDDIRGLFDYLHARMEVRQQMQERGFATLDSKGAGPLRAQWEATVTRLKAQNLSFADLHHRWLSNDNLAYGFLLPGSVNGAEEV